MLNLKKSFKQNFVVIKKSLETILFFLYILFLQKHK